MIKISKTQKTTVVAVGALILSGGAYLFFFSHINALYAELQTVQKEINILDTAIQNEQDTQTLLERTTDAREKLKKRFVPTEDPTPFLETIESTAESAGVELEIERVNVEELDEDVKEPQKVLMLTLIVSGDWQGIYRLLSLLETVPYASTVTNASVEYEEKDDVYGWSGQIQLQTLAL